MGSITSRPKVPTTPRVVYVPQPAPAPAPAPTQPATPPSNDAGGGNENNDTAAREVREQNLLTRERSRYGTVRTGFRGLLSLASAAGDNTKRKTLLGE